MSFYVRNMTARAPSPCKPRTHTLFASEECIKSTDWVTCWPNDRQTDRQMNGRTDGLNKRPADQPAIIHWLWGNISKVLWRKVGCLWQGHFMALKDIIQKQATICSYCCCCCCCCGYCWDIHQRYEKLSWHLRLAYFVNNVIFVNDSPDHISYIKLLL